MSFFPNSIGLIACLLAGAFLLPCTIIPAQIISDPSPSPTPDFALLTLDSLASPRTVAAERAAFLRKMREEVIEKRFSDALTPETESEWQGAFWAALLIRERNPRVREAISRVLATWPERGASLQRQTLEALHGLFPTEFRVELRALLPAIESPKLFAMAAECLLSGDNDDSEVRGEIRKRLESQFPGANENTILHCLARRLTAPDEPPPPAPPLVDLFAHPFLPGKPVLFSIQRRDRRHPGIAVIRNADGRFQRRPDGQLFHVSQLALSASNLPGYLTNGNSPHGLYSIRGLDVSSNVFISPTPFLWSRLPFEAEPRDFLHGAKENAGTGAVDAPTTWTLDLYRSLWPESWRAHAPIEQAYWAGMAGRSEIILHGTTINPEFYRGEPCHPLTPSLGCLCTMELWSPETGRAEVSDQLALVRAWLASGDGNGMLVVVELDGPPSPVRLEEIVLDLLAAEETTPRR